MITINKILPFGTIDSIRLQNYNGFTKSGEVDKYIMKRLVSLVLVIGFAIAGCGGYGGYGSLQTTPQAAPPVSGEEIGVTASYAKFQPSRVEVSKDKPAHLKLTSADTNHTFTVDELGINVSIPAGKTVTQEITVNKTGTYSFYCAVPGHRQAGMQGSLEVK